MLVAYFLCQGLCFCARAALRQYCRLDGLHNGMVFSCWDGGYKAKVLLSSETPPVGILSPGLFTDFLPVRFCVLISCYKDTSPGRLRPWINVLASLMSPCPSVVSLTFRDNWGFSISVRKLGKRGDTIYPLACIDC